MPSPRICDLLLGPCLSICTVQLCSDGFDHFNDFDNFDDFDYFGDFDEFDNCDILTNFGFDNVDGLYDSNYSGNSISSSEIDSMYNDPAKLQTYSLVCPTNLLWGYPKPNINLEIISATFCHTLEL